MKNKPDCFGNFLNEETKKCERICNKNEHRECYEEWNRRNKEKQKLAERCKLPWYKQGV